MRKVGDSEAKIAADLMQNFFQQEILAKNRMIQENNKKKKEIIRGAALGNKSAYLSPGKSPRLTSTTRDASPRQ